jgi:hypothetical protein
MRVLYLSPIVEGSARNHKVEMLEARKGHHAFMVPLAARMIPGPLGRTQPIIPTSGEHGMTEHAVSEHTPNTADLSCAIARPQYGC